MCNYYRYFHEGFWRYIYLPEDATTKLGSSPKLERVNVIEMKDAHDPCAKIYTLHSHYIFVKGTWESVSEFLSEKYGGKYGGLYEWSFDTIDTEKATRAKQFVDQMKKQMDEHSRSLERLRAKYDQIRPHIEWLVDRDAQEMMMKTK